MQIRRVFFLGGGGRGWFPIHLLAGVEAVVAVYPYSSLLVTRYCFTDKYHLRLFGQLSPKQILL